MNISVIFQDSTTLTIAGVVSVKEEGLYTCFYASDNILSLASCLTSTVRYWKQV